MITLLCREDNDLYTVLRRAGFDGLRRTDPGGASTVAAAIAAVPAGSGVAVLSDTYPTPSRVLTAAHIQAAAEKDLRLYVEYPAAVEGVAMGSPTPTEKERVVVTSAFFEGRPAVESILALHGCWYLPMAADSKGRGVLQSHLAVGTVAGFRTAVYGLPADARPILAGHPTAQSVLIAASGLSHFVRGRYAPYSSWKAVWERILSWLLGTEAPQLSWTPSVGPTYDRDAAISEGADGAEAEACRRSASWFRSYALYSVDWKRGAIEGYQSGIDHRGRQLPRIVARADCIAEAGMVFGFAALRDGPALEPADAKTAADLLRYVWSSPDFVQDDPAKSSYGLVNWDAGRPVFYGDDNARVILGSLAASRLLDSSEWDERILRCLFANYRTTGPLGFRKARLELPRSFAEGRTWRDWFCDPVEHFAPHYQGYLWAALLSLAAATGQYDLAERPVTALRLTLERYPTLSWTNGMSQEMARLLLPLSFLVRLQEGARHGGHRDIGGEVARFPARDHLLRVVDDLVIDMVDCGAIRERLGSMESGQYPPPRSNEEYGRSEAPVIQENSDPACDLLYTIGFAFLGLHEAAAATGEPRVRAAEDRLAEFLVRIQVESVDHPYLSGAWMRAFDFHAWEYWGSSADEGWGAWCIESGWFNAWIHAVFALRSRGGTLWDLCADKRLGAAAARIRAEMLPEA